MTREATLPNLALQRTWTFSHEFYRAQTMTHSWTQQSRRMRARIMCAVRVESRIDNPWSDTQRGQTELQFPCSVGSSPFSGFLSEVTRSGVRPSCNFRAQRGPCSAGSGRVAISALSGACSVGRVDLGGHPPRPPTDPDVHVKCIRLFIS